MKIETLAIQSTRFEDENAGAVAAPIYLSTTFEREADGSFAKNLVYSRTDNPNRQHLEKSLSLLENGTHGFAFASGMASIATVLQLLNSGDHIITGDDIYWAATIQMKDIFGHFGISVTQVDMSNIEKIQKAIQPNTRLFWVETPSNPLLKIADIQQIANLAHENNALCGVDNTWATPVLQKPLDLGSDITQHSTTKYIGGHSDVLGGALVVKNEELAEKLRKIQIYGGAVASPFDCWLLSRGIKTLPLRVKTQTQNAKLIAEYLFNHPKVEAVHYPGLESHSGYEIARKQMSDFGAMLSFQVKGGREEAMQVAAKLKLFTRATSLGGVESLIEHRRSVEGTQSQTPHNLLRMSIGIEDVNDLIEDLEQAI